jgi:hypothetical protein
MLPSSTCFEGGAREIHDTHDLDMAPNRTRPRVQSSVVWVQNVMCRWHARLNVSWVRAVANSTEMAVLSSDSKPLLAESFSELTGFRDGIRGFRRDSAGEYPGRTRW